MRSGDLPPEVDRGPPAEQYLIRAATVDDATGIAEVLVASWRSAYRGLLPQELLDGLIVERRAAQWRRDIRDPTCAVHVATDPAGRLGGFIAVGPSQDQDAAGAVGALFAVYLAPRLWSRGVGGRLHAAGIAALAARFEEATLRVLDSNARARAFYEPLRKSSVSTSAGVTTAGSLIRQSGLLPRRRFDLPVLSFVV